MAARFLEHSLVEMTDVGRVRQSNEDAMGSYLPVLTEPEHLAGMLVLSDGMGGMLLEKLPAR